MVVVLADGEVVVHDHLLEDPLVEDPRHVYSVFVNIEVGEDGLDAVVLLGQARNGAEEVAVPDPALEDVLRVDGAAPHEAGLLDYFVDPLPDHLLGLPPQPEGALLRGEVGVGPLLAGVGVLFHDFLVVGLEDLLDYEIGELGVVGLDEVHDVVELALGLEAGVLAHVVDDPGAGPRHEPLQLDGLVLADFGDPWRVVNLKGVLGSLVLLPAAEKHPQLLYPEPSVNICVSSNITPGLFPYKYHPPLTGALCYCNHRLVMYFLVKKRTREDCTCGNYSPESLLGPHLFSSISSSGSEWVGLSLG